MQCNKKLELVVAIPFSTDWDLWDLQKFFQESFQTLKLTSTHVI